MRCCSVQTFWSTGAWPTAVAWHLSHLDDDLAFSTSCFDVSHSLFGRFKLEDPVQDRAYAPCLDERTDLFQLIPACSHEEKGIADLMTFGQPSDPEAEQTHHQF